MPTSRTLQLLLTTVLLIPVLTPGLTSASLATPLGDALATLNRGQTGAAVTLLQGRRDAPSLALLARAYVGQSVFETSAGGKKKLYVASKAAARAAIAADPKDAGGYVELANALALQLQGAGVLEATRSGLEIRRLFERAVALDSGQARAWMGLGAWHAQALGLGAVVAWTTGASEQKMRAGHQRAIDLSPGEIFFQLNYADSLLLLAHRDGARRAALTREARTLLGEALALTPQNYWQAYDHRQVQQRLAGLIDVAR